MCIRRLSTLYTRINMNGQRSRFGVAFWRPFKSAPGATASSRPTCSYAHRQLLTNTWCVLSNRHVMYHVLDDFGRRGENKRSARQLVCMYVRIYNTYVANDFYSRPKIIAYDVTRTFLGTYTIYNMCNGTNLSNTHDRRRWWMCRFFFCEAYWLLNCKGYVIR